MKTWKSCQKWRSRNIFSAVDHAFYEDCATNTFSKSISPEMALFSNTCLVSQWVQQNLQKLSSFLNFNASAAKKINRKRKSQTSEDSENLATSYVLQATETTQTWTILKKMGSITLELWFSFALVRNDS